MTKIGLISDTHGFLDEQVFKYFENCHEIWHAGDFGTMEAANKLSEFKPLKGVYGNVDDQNIRAVYPENLFFRCEEVKVFMTHIGGYPPKYNKRTKSLLSKTKSQLFISGHSHIVKVIYDEELKCLHMNPGAAGKEGMHQERTIIRFAINGKNISDCEVIKLGKRFATI